VHVSELGSEYFQYNDVAHELRGERTGRRFKLNDDLHVQVSRVDLEARRIEFRLVERFGMKALTSAPVSAPRKAASAKSEATKAARSARKATTKPTAAAKRAGKASPGKPGGKTARRRTKR
jgi:ribonuclease R